MAKKEEENFEGDEIQYDEDNGEAQEELFKANPLKAIWIKLKEIEEEVQGVKDFLIQEEIEYEG